MTKTFYFFLLIIVLFSCSQEKMLPELNKDEISGKRLWERITVEEDFDDYPEWPGFEGLQLGQSPHGRYHEIYINPILRNALPIKDRIAPYGSIIVKENYNADKNLTNLTVMAKIKDYNPENNDWFWVMYDVNGKIMAEGKPDMCISCHKGLKDNDYVIVRPLDKPLRAEE